MQHPGPRLPAAALRCLRVRQAGRLFLQAARLLSVVPGSAHGPNSGAPGRPCHPARAGAPVDAGTAHPPAPAAGRATQDGDAEAAGRTPCGCALPARSGRAEGRAGPPRRRHADPALWVGRQSEHSRSLPGAGRRVPVRHRRRTCLRRSTRADRRAAAGGVAKDHHPIDASCSPARGRSSKSRDSPTCAPPTPIRTRPTRSGRCRPRRLPIASPLARAPGRRC